MQPNKLLLTAIITFYLMVALQATNYVVSPLIYNISNAKRGHPYMTDISRIQVKLSQHTGTHFLAEEVMKEKVLTLLNRTHGINTQTDKAYTQCQQNLCTCFVKAIDCLNLNTVLMNCKNEIVISYGKWLYCYM